MTAMLQTRALPSRRRTGGSTGAYCSCGLLARTAAERGEATSRRLAVLAAVSLVLALSGGPLATLAAPSAPPAAAPDNSIVLQPFRSGLTELVFITNAGDGS